MRQARALDPSWRRIHMVGIGGAGMSAMARVLMSMGVEVSGSDLRDSAVLQALAHAGVKTAVGHDAGNLEGAAAVIASSAVPSGNPEVAAAAAAGIPVISRGEALGAMLAGRRVAAVSGTHGKTTTSAMVAAILDFSGADPTWVVGADIAGELPGGRLGGGNLAVVEADEAYRSMLWIDPAVAAVTNIDYDHVDHYGSMTGLEDAFASFLAAAHEGAVVCADDARAAAAGGRVRGCRTYGFSAGAWVRGVRYLPSGAHSQFDLEVDGASAQVRLGVPGAHNAVNALGAAAVCLMLGVDVESAAAGLGRFRGVRRRFEHRGRHAGADLIDDYAHHPAEIAATLQAARAGAWRRVVAVFQPHLYSRTGALWREFGEALALADVVVVTDVYGAREEPVPGVTGKLVVDGVCEAAPGKRVAWLPRLDEAAAYAAGEAREGDLIISLGAGDVTTLPDRIREGG